MGGVIRVGYGGSMCWGEVESMIVRTLTFFQVDVVVMRLFLKS